MILTTVKDNVKEAVKILKAWEKNLMFDRKEGKTYTFEELNETFKSLITQRHGEIRDGGGRRVCGGGGGERRGGASMGASRRFARQQKNKFQDGTRTQTRIDTH